MRISLFLSLCITGVALSAASFAATPVKKLASPVLRSTIRDVASRGAAMAPAELAPGDVFAITGDCIAQAQSADNLRVVMTFSDTTAGSQGFHSMIATDQSIEDNALHVRVPNLPDTANRTFDVKVFALGQNAPQVCEAGHIRIGATATGKVG